MITRCVACARVRIGADMTWIDHPGILDGEIGMICATCSEKLRQQQAQEYRKNVRRTRRRLAGKEPWAPGTAPDDPFENMREPRADKARG